MRPVIFVDSSAWIAVADADDQDHQKVVKTYRHLLRSYMLVTTNMVVAETYTVLRYGCGISTSLNFLTGVRTSPRIWIVISNAELEHAAEALLAKYSDQTFSYTDAVSFAYMRANRVEQAFALDKHFDTAGFQRVTIFAG